MTRNLIAILLVSLFLAACGTSNNSEKTIGELAEEKETIVIKEEEIKEEILETKSEENSNMEETKKADETKENSSIEENDDKKEIVNSDQNTQNITTDKKTETTQVAKKEETKKAEVKKEEKQVTSTKQTKPSTTKKESTSVGNEQPKEEKESVEEQPKEKVALAKTPTEATGDSTIITWDEFFDGVDQTKPSLKFEKLNGKKVELTGYMGEVLDFGGGWFLLIEVDGGDCPFCSTDESYWNKVIVIYAKNKDYIRNIPGKVKVSGTLDVGIKQDGTGYKTMFRLYHAEFSSAK